MLLVISACQFSNMCMPYGLYFNINNGFEDHCLTVNADLVLVPVVVFRSVQILPVMKNRSVHTYPKRCTANAADGNNDNSELLRREFKFTV
jgi:hypothetical protein